MVKGQGSRLLLPGTCPSFLSRIVLSMTISSAFRMLVDVHRVFRQLPLSRFRSVFLQERVPCEFRTLDLNLNSYLVHVLLLDHWKRRTHGIDVFSDARSTTCSCCTCILGCSEYHLLLLYLRVLLYSQQTACAGVHIHVCRSNVVLSNTSWEFRVQGRSSYSHDPGRRDEISDGCGVAQKS